MQTCAVVRRQRVPRHDRPNDPGWLHEPRRLDRSGRGDVESWYRFYGVDLDGIFLDDGQSDCAVAAAYGALETDIKQHHPGALVAANPGAPVPPCYDSTADLLLTFEGRLATYTDHFVGLDWTPSDPSKIWHVVYAAAGGGAVKEAVALSKQRGAGYVYVTDAAGSNPYDALPSAWPDELAAASSALTGPASLRGRTVQVVVAGRVGDARVRVSARRRVAARP